VKAALSLGLCLLAAGCSDDDPPKPVPTFAPAQTCGVKVEVTGSVTATLSGKADEVTCTTGLPQTGVRAGYQPVAGELMALDLRVDDVGKGVTGSNFAATLNVQTRDEAWTQHFCAVDVTEHTFIGPGQRLSEPYGEGFRVVGFGRCTPSAGSEHVSVGPLEFVTVITW
jgi:hypothetical protein